MKIITTILLVCLPAPLWAAGEPPLVDTLGLAAMSAAIDANEYRRIEAIIVDRGGETVFEDYYRRSSAESRIDARSTGKSITAIAVGMAIDDGALAGLDLPLLSFFADHEPIAHDGEAKRAILLSDILSMSSALDCNDWTEESPGNEERMYSTDNWTRFALDIPIDQNYRVHEESGQGRFSYCTAGAFLMGRVVESAVGEPFENYVQRRLFDLLGIVDPEWRRAPEGVAQTGGQLSLRARDFASIGRFVLDGANNDNGTLVSRTWLREMLRPRVQATPDQAYGYLWWVANFRVGESEAVYSGFFMSGNGGNKVVLFPELGTVVTILSTNYNRRDMHQQTQALIEDHILPALVATSETAEPVH